ncbi:hypothetical protein COO60DRAFT_1535494 [Scenedesmus sp. NREL 46B-D3]|nr:hypothetical protein COO60DRAFT_1535494 [Scenedesmus sp. NREL 46B-D3]
MSVQAYMSNYDTRSISSRSGSSRTNAIEYYGAQYEAQEGEGDPPTAGDPPNKPIYCCVTGRYHSKNVTAAHIYQLGWPRSEAVSLIIEINSPRNILLMYSSVEKALDQMRLMILPQEDNEFMVVVLDKSLLDNWIDDEQDSGRRMRFRDVHEKRLHWLGIKRPYKRSCLAHALHALMKACNMGWMELTQAQQYRLERLPRSPGCDQQLLDNFFADENQLLWAQGTNADTVVLEAGSVADGSSG